MTIRPLHNMVIVDRDPKPDMSTGGIALPFVDPALVRTGTVVAVGPGVYDEKGTLIGTGVEVGDRIAFSRDHIKDFDINGEQVSFLMGKGIFGKLP